MDNIITRPSSPLLNTSWSYISEIFSYNWDVDGLSELKDEGYLNYQTAFRTYDDLVNLTKKIIKEIKEDIRNGRYDKIENKEIRKGKYNEYVNKEAIEKLEKEVDPEELAKKYAEIIYKELKSKYNNNLEAQSEEIEAVA